MKVLPHLSLGMALAGLPLAAAHAQHLDRAAEGIDCADAAQQLIVAQRAWITLRDQDCDAVYAFNADGTSRNGAKMHCLTTHAQDRTRQLRDFYEL